MNREQRMSKANEAGLKTHEHFEMLIDELATLRLEKVVQYSEARYEEPDAVFNRLMVFSDIYRKFIRLKQQLWTDRDTTPDDHKLCTDLMDLASYCLMGVQLLRDVDWIPATPNQIIGMDLAKRSFIPVIEQIAIKVENPLSVIAMFKELGYDEWTEDEVTAEGNVLGVPNCTNVARLYFNYQIFDGVEFELIRYHTGPNWLDQCGYGLSHLGVHVDDIQPAVNAMIALGYRVAQDVRTIKHTNAAIKDTRRYRYVIFDTRHTLGFDLKFIQRLEP